MDIHDYESGVGKDFFWFRGKEGLIGVLFGKLKPVEKSRILVLGAGTGADLRVIGRFGEIFATEPDPKALALIPEELVAEKMSADACDLPFDDSSFDAVAAFDVLEHIEEDERAISETYRVLKPGGSFVFSVPAFDWLFSSHDRALGHCRRWDRKIASRRLSRFCHVELGYWVFSLFVPVVLQRLLRRNDPNPKVKYPRLPKAVNEILYRFLLIENKLIQSEISFPFGTSLYGICRK